MKIFLGEKKMFFELKNISVESKLKKSNQDNKFLPKCWHKQISYSKFSAFKRAKKDKILAKFQIY